MKTIAQLRTLGFVLTKSANAESCTALEYPGPFYYFNPKFCDTPQDVAEKLRKGQPTGVGSYTAFLVAGDFHSVRDDTQFPFEVLSVNAHAAIASAHQALQKAQAVFNEASTAFTKAIATHVPH